MPDEAAAFRAALDRFDAGRPPLILGHNDADGLGATAILARALARAGRPASTRIVGRGENAWSADLRAEVAAQAPGGLIVTDLGIGDGDVAPNVPTIVIDHHVPSGVPGDAIVVSGNGLDPEPTSALLAWRCAGALGDQSDLLWLAALGLIGDMAEGAAFPEMAAAQARWGKTALRDATALVNAPRRSSTGDAWPALALLMRCDGPKEVLSGARPETALLLAARDEVRLESEAARRVPPRVRGDVALIRLHSACQVHPLVAQSWRGRLKDKVVIAANTGFRDGWVHFAARTATGTNLIEFFADHRPPGATEQYGQGHAQASGGALRRDDWAAFAASIGFPEEEFS